MADIISLAERRAAKAATVPLSTQDNILRLIQRTRSLLSDGMTTLCSGKAEPATDKKWRRRSGRTVDSPGLRNKGIGSRLLNLGWTNGDDLLSPAIWLASLTWNTTSGQHRKHRVPRMQPLRKEAPSYHWV